MGARALLGDQLPVTDGLYGVFGVGQFSWWWGCCCGWVRGL